MSGLPSRVLDALRPWLGAQAWKVAFSGGLDSTVLLAVLDELRREHSLPPLCAIHVHHGLQASADAWAAHCAAFCAERQIPFHEFRVRVAPGASLEAAARAARYEALSKGIGAKEVLLTAHHRDDQAETLLFRLMRGSGVKGLAAMPAERSLGKGGLVRPLLTIGRDELEAWARGSGLSWVEDPSNEDVRFSRNAIRRQVMPSLKMHWPQLQRTLAQTAEHMREAHGLLEELAAIDLPQVTGSPPFAWLPLPSLDLQELAKLSEPRQRNLLRHWLAAYTALPDTAHWHGWDCLRDARADATPVWRVQGGELQRCAGRLWFVPAGWLGAPAEPDHVGRHGQSWELPGNGRVRLLSRSSHQEDALRIGYRRGGERVNVAGRGHRDLKRLLNEACIPTFVRGRLPLLFEADRLIAVANLPAASEDNVTLVWEPPGLR